RPHPTATLFPYTTLFRSARGDGVVDVLRVDLAVGVQHVDQDRLRPAGGHGRQVRADLRADAVQPVARDARLLEDRLALTWRPWPDRKSTRLNSSHDQISY